MPDDLLMGSYINKMQNAHLEIYHCNYLIYASWKYELISSWTVVWFLGSNIIMLSNTDYIPLQLNFFYSLVIKGWRIRSLIWDNGDGAQ